MVRARYALLFVPLALAGLLSCGEDGPTVDPLAEDKRAAMGQIGTLIQARVASFATLAADLETAAAAYAATPTDESARTAAQNAWTAAMDAWQVLEVLQIGPAGEPRSGSVGTLGGQDLRADIYSWPAVNPCRVDQEVVEEAYADVDSFLANELPNARGLDAMEYLLFAADGENACNPLDPINDDGTWAALGDETVQARRAAYARTAATGVARAAQALDEAWSSSGGNFANELATAGDGSTLYTSAQSALEDVSAQVLYLDVATQDMKIGDPSGLRMSTVRACTEPPCPDIVESRFAQRSRSHILRNIEGFRLAFTGGDGQGLDDLLAEVGAEATATTILAELDAATTAIEGTGDPLSANLDATTVADAFAALGRAMDAFRTGYVTALDVRLPMGPVGDND